jgi:hypothetical protein
MAGTLFFAGRLSASLLPSTVRRSPLCTILCFSPAPLRRPDHENFRKIPTFPRIPMKVFPIWAAYGIGRLLHPPLAALPGAQSRKRLE